MKKLLFFGAIIGLLWGITKFWPSRTESEGPVEVRVNARRPSVNHPKAKTH